MNCAASPQRSPKATSRLFSNPPNTQARPPTSPQRNDCYMYARTFASASRELITMVARHHHLAIQIAQFGHDLTLTSQRAIWRWENAKRDRSRKRSWNAKSWGANLGRKSWDECMREVPEMSERAREFLEHWMTDHVGAVADEYRMRETVRLVALCREDAISRRRCAGRAANGSGRQFDSMHVGSLERGGSTDQANRRVELAEVPWAGIEAFPPSTRIMLPNVP